MHILLRPVPGLSATLERCKATLLFAAAKCTNIDSDIPRQAPSAITGNKMAPRGTRKNTLLAAWARGSLARVAAAPAETDQDQRAPHQSLVRPSLRRHARDDRSRPPYADLSPTRDEPWTGRSLEAPDLSAASFPAARLA